tara:strand:- start:628 stop:876 length:249 start_codon:yes stop_codon:yes gene_type:complete
MSTPFKMKGSAFYGKSPLKQDLPTSKAHSTYVAPPANIPVITEDKPLRGFPGYGMSKKFTKLKKIKQETLVQKHKRRTGQLK